MLLKASGVAGAAAWLIVVGDEAGLRWLLHAANVRISPHAKKFEKLPNSSIKVSSTYMD